MEDERPYSAQDPIPDRPRPVSEASAEELAESRAQLRREYPKQNLWPR